MNRRQQTLLPISPLTGRSVIGVLYLEVYMCWEGFEQSGKLRVSVKLGRVKQEGLG